MSNMKLKIRPTVLVLILFLVGVSVTSTLLFQYFNSKELAHSAVLNYVQQLTKSTQTHLNNFNKSNYDLLLLLEQTQNIEKNPKEKNNMALIKKFATGMKNNPFIYATYVGYDNGDFYELINLDIDPSLRKSFNTSLKERWLVVNIFDKENKKVRINYFLDENFNLLRTQELKAKYNPTVRPWYKTASKSKEVIVTSPYMFTNLDAYGLTYAKRLEEKGAVIGVDVSLRSLSLLLASNGAGFKKTQIYLFDKNRKLIASNLSNEVSKKYAEKLNANKKYEGKVFELKGEEFLIISQNLDTKYSNDNFVTILVSEDEAMKPFNDKIVQAIAVNIFLLLFVIPLTWFTTKLIIDPIQELEEENEKVKNLKFDDVKLVKTPIREIFDLSTSFVSMSKSIQRYEKSLQELMDSFIKLMASAIDAKSEYTGGHCSRVPKLTMLLAQEASACKEGIFKDFKLDSKEQLRELEVASWLHDCGKVTTPEYVVDKAVKLETIYNRIHEVRMRFEVIYRDLKIEAFEKKALGEKSNDVDIWLNKKYKQLQEEFAFIAKTNIGGEFMSEEDIKKVQTIAKKQWRKYFDDSLGLTFDEQERYVKTENKMEYLLSDKKSHIILRNDCAKKDQEKYGFKGEVPKYLYNYGEIYNLSIQRGTLTKEERYKINDHINMTIKMLEELPFPNNLKNVPEYAAAHHETLVGTGYPRELTRDQMSIPARIMALSDVFEALTAADRPYKKAKTLSESIKILSFMVKDKHLDEDIFKLFLQKGVFLKYAKEFLTEEQIDLVDIKEYIK